MFHGLTNNPVAAAIPVCCLLGSWQDGSRNGPDETYPYVENTSQKLLPFPLCRAVIMVCHI